MSTRSWENSSTDTILDVQLLSEEQKENARRAVARQALDEQDEQTLLKMLGLDE